MDTESIETKKPFKVGQTVYWYSTNGLALSGEIVKMNNPFVTTRISGGQRRQVRIDKLSCEKLKQKLKSLRNILS